MRMLPVRIMRTLDLLLLGAGQAAYWLLTGRNDTFDGMWRYRFELWCIWRRGGDYSVAETGSRS